MTNPFLNQAISDQIIALAYYAIPVALALSERARRMVVRAHAESRMILLFTSFVISCAVGHQIDSFYEFHGVCASLSPLREGWSWLTASLSVLTVVLLLPSIFKYLAILEAVDMTDLIKRIKEIEADLGRR